MNSTIIKSNGTYKIQKEDGTLLHTLGGDVWEHPTLSIAEQVLIDYVAQNQFVLTWDNGINSFQQSYGLDLDKAIRDFDYWSRSDATSHTIYPATIEIRFNGNVIRTYGI